MVSQLPRQSAKRVLWALLKYVLAFGLLAVLIWRFWAPPGGHGLAFLWNKHVVQGVPIRWNFLALATGILAISLLITFVRWYVLVRAQELPFTLFNAVRLGLVGYFFNIFLPGSVSGDVVKAAFLARDQSRRTVAVATVVMDRVLALWGLFWFVAVLGLVFWALGMLEPSTQRITLVCAVLVGCSVPVWVLLGYLPAYRAERFAERLGRLRKVGPAAAEFWRAVWMYRCRQGSVAVTLLLAWVGHAGFVFAFYFSVLTLWSPEYGPIPSLAQHFLIVPLALLVQAVPLFPSGVGVGEAGFGALYAMLGSDPVVGVIGCLLSQRVLAWTLGLLGYGVSQCMGTGSPPAAATPAADPEPAPPRAVAV
ncbi:MAG TPA: lysylphosphatidylglycerol synthase transmembrane domain-containing protein [Gemmataceae bacterium]|nr:lysylphosphatidylglycerol synthase transmembrane domain-containing protein [Gemmataceae bacterium]